MELNPNSLFTQGNIDEKVIRNVASDVIFSERRGQSQKPEEVYQYIEELVPNGKLVNWSS